MKKDSKPIFIFCTFLAIVGFSLYQLQTKVLAEQSGSSPESGVTSRIKTIYDSLVSLAHGSESAGGWGNWGVMWNRIRSAAEWVPTGDATEADVVSGKTFYKDSRTQKTGTAPSAFDYSTQKLATKDDYLGTYKAEESAWSEVMSSPFSGFGALNLLTGKVKQDGRTGLWWSASSTGVKTNLFTLSADGARPTGGDALAFCNALNSASFGGKIDWYLPTQKELHQAYIDGMYSQDSVFATTNSFWSSTEYSMDALGAWNLNLYTGSQSWNSKEDAYKSVRCVRRD